MEITRIRIMLVDDHKIVRDSWKILLENNPLFDVVEACALTDLVPAIARQVKPDIILLDIHLSPAISYAMAEKLRRELPEVKLIGLSANNQPKVAIRMLSIGASGYLTKTSSLEEINRGIVEVHNGTVFVSEEVKKFILGN